MFPVFFLRWLLYSKKEYLDQKSYLAKKDGSPWLVKFSPGQTQKILDILFHCFVWQNIVLTISIIINDNLIPILFSKYFSSNPVLWSPFQPVKIQTKHDWRVHCKMFYVKWHKWPLHSNFQMGGPKREKGPWLDGGLARDSQLS